MGVYNINSLVIYYVNIIYNKISASTLLSYLIIHFSDDLAAIMIHQYFNKYACPFRLK
jgi:hypothetical protein